MLHLSLRLKTIASLVPLGARVCDVGTDHAHLAIYLKQTGVAKTVIATDLNRKPLENAKKNIELSGVTDITLRLCDGLSDVNPEEADTVIIAGMGGEVITHILRSCHWAKSSDLTLILQPTTSAEILREFLCENGFEIKSETPVFENRKLYSVMLVKFTGKICSFPHSYYYTGKIPLTPDGILYIKKQQKRIFECMKAFEGTPTKQKEFRIYKKIYDDINIFLTENNNGT